MILRNIFTLLDPTHPLIILSLGKKRKFSFIIVFSYRYRLPADRLWISVYEDDDEAFAIWNKEVS